MSWKRFLIIFVNLLFIFFPYNILGCGGGIDPFDYFTSFFQNDLTAEKSWKPFYYTNYQFLYSEEEPEDVAQATSSEWIQYCGGKIDKKQAYDFVCKYAYKDLANIYYFIEKNQPLKIPDSVKNNKMTAYFFGNKDLQALGYLMYAKQVEPFVIGNWNEWEPGKRDSTKMNRLIKNGLQLYAASTNDFIKLRYAYQVLRLAHYSGRFEDCIKLHDQLVQNNPATSVLHNLSASLKAGALYKLGQKNQAAYIFSKQFSASDVKKVSNYMSFEWCVKRLDEGNRKQCLNLCKNNEEKANLLGLFALGSNINELKTLKNIAALSADAPVFRMLATREVNKIEDNYLSPYLSKQKGGTRLYSRWMEENTGQSQQQWASEAKELSVFFHTLAQNGNLKDACFFEISAAYLAYINKNYTDAKKYLANSAKLDLSGSLKDQWALTNLLVAINEQEKIDAGLEEQLLPSLKWLESKAANEKRTEAGIFGSENQWQKFYRNVLIEILAKRYHGQGDIYKEALCIGNAFLGEDYVVKDFVRNNMQTKDLMALHSLLQSSSKNKWEQFLCTSFAMKNDHVTDMIATTHIRDYNFVTSLEWIGKIKDKEVLKLERNPFANLLKDNQDSIYSFDKGLFTKASFIKEMHALAEKEKQGKASDADLYKLATGYYNMTYYGRAWEMVKHERSGADGYHIPENATVFEKEYYGCFTAEQTFKKAMAASTDADFKARCLFMMAKCAQKQIPRPQYSESGDLNVYEKNEKQYLIQFKYNKYFPQLIKDFGKTQFYKEAINTCSYLKDFVNKK